MNMERTIISNILTAECKHCAKCPGCKHYESQAADIIDALTTRAELAERRLAMAEKKLRDREFIYVGSDVWSVRVWPCDWRDCKSFTAALDAAIEEDGK